MLLSQKTNSSLERRKKEVILQQYQRGDEISVLDLGIWQVYRGVVQLSRIQQDGNEVISGWISASGVFGNLALSRRSVRRCLYKVLFRPGYPRRSESEQTFPRSV